MQARAPVAEQAAPDLSFSSASIRFTGKSALCQVARLCVEPASAASIATDAWPALLRTALEHGVAPRLHLRLKAEALPQAVRVELERIYRSNLARNLALDHQRAILEERLRERVHPVIALKGPQLAERLYGDPGARQVADLDFLIRASDLPAADEVFLQSGWQREAPESIARLQTCRDVLYAKELGKGSHVYVDLHLRLRAYGRKDTLAEGVLREGMTRENLLLCLCLNIVTHRFARLQPLLDLAAFLRNEGGQLDWVLVSASAAALEWSSGVFYCLTWAAQVGAPAAPSQALEALRPGRVVRRWTEAVLARDVFSLLDRSKRLEGPYGALALLGCEKGFAPKWRLAASILFPPGPALRQMDSRGQRLLLPLHYADRLARKARELTQKQRQ